MYWQANLPQLEADYFATMLHELDLEEEASNSEEIWGKREGCEERQRLGVTERGRVQCRREDSPCTKVEGRWDGSCGKGVWWVPPSMANAGTD